MINQDRLPSFKKKRRKMTQSTATTGQKVKFATQLSLDALAKLHQMAHEKGRQIQPILDEDLREYIETKGVVSHALM